MYRKAAKCANKKGLGSENNLYLSCAERIPRIPGLSGERNPASKDFRGFDRNSVWLPSRAWVSRDRKGIGWILADWVVALGCLGFLAYAEKRQTDGPGKEPFEFRGDAHHLVVKDHLGFGDDLLFQ